MKIDRENEKQKFLALSGNSFKAALFCNSINENYRHELCYAQAAARKRYC